MIIGREEGCESKTINGYIDCLKWVKSEKPKKCSPRKDYLDE